MKKHTLPVIVGLWAATVAAAYFAGHNNNAIPAGQGTANPARSGDARSLGSDGRGGPITTETKNAGPWQAGQETGGATTPARALAAMRAALDNPNALERTRAVLAALDNLDSDGMKQAYEMIRAQDDGMAARMQTMLLMYAWGRKDPEAALAFNKENGSERGTFTVLSSWAQVSPDKAIAWAQASANKDDQGNPSGDNWAMVGVVNGLVKSDLGKAAQALQMMNRSNARGEALDMVLDSMSKSDPAGVREWVGKIADPVLREGAAERLGRKLAQSDPSQAAAWVATLPDAASKSRAAGGVLEHWAQTDPNAAGEWVKSSFPAGPASDGPREIFSMMIEGQDPQSALAWAGTISDQARREGAMREIARNWVRREGDAARAVLQQTPNLPEAVRAKLQRK